MPEPTNCSLKESVLQQRKMLTGVLGKAMHELANDCSGILDERVLLKGVLSSALPGFTFCKHLYVMDRGGVQVTDNISPTGRDATHFGRDRSTRPYMQGIVGTTDFKLSQAYISCNNKRPSLTAIQVIRNGQGEHIGFLGADFDLRELPRTGASYAEPKVWRQIKGDPAIRGGLFLQTRAESMLDSRLDEVLPIMHELMSEHGVFHGKLHYSSSRATIWQADDPFIYHLLNIDEVTDPDICLAYPRRPYHERAMVPREQIPEVFEMFSKLRFADENIYLRAGSLNIINGMVGMNFSCDGSHYMPYKEFLDKSTDFWFGTTR
ncbi:MAG: PDC sensor domain-containing protein [Candidatus Sedimenticola endophacoides]